MEKEEKINKTVWKKGKKGTIENGKQAKKKWKWKEMNKKGKKKVNMEKEEKINRKIWKK